MAEEGLAYIIQNTHYGSLEATIEDIKKLGDLDEQAMWFRNAVRSHCESNLFLLSNEEGTEKLVVSAANRASEQEDGTTVYTDVSALKHHTVCFTQRKIIQSAEYDQSDPSDSQTVAGRVAAGLKRYLDEFFSKNSGSFAVIGADNNLHFGYTSKTHNADSFYSGHWNSEWKFDFGTKRLTGGTTIAVHLYEEGNTFFQDRKDAEPEDLEKPVSSPNELAEEILSAVMGMERKLVKRLDQHFEEEGTECLKTLRLALPITQSPIDWDVNLAMVVSQLAAVAPKKP